MGFLVYARRANQGFEEQKKQKQKSFLLMDIVGLLQGSIQGNS